MGIRGRRVDELKRFLAEHHGKGLAQMLLEPTDGHLNTLLHIAVQHRQVAMTQELCAFGAQSSLCNLRGDTPMQWRAFPRISKAAWSCRYHRPRPVLDICPKDAQTQMVDSDSNEA